jgi:PAS domain-containing protein
MTIQFDHVIIYVDDLERAMTDFKALGFSVLRGGEHPEMGTHNALVIFQDRTYIELLAPAPGRTQQGFPGRLGQAGYASFCLRADALADELRAAAERGVTLSPLKSGSRTRLDGQRVEWRIATIAGLDAPFFIEDVTDRRLRISTDRAANQHANGVVGSVSLTVLVSDVVLAAPRYGSILGVTPEMLDDRAGFDLGGFTLVLRLPENEEERAYLAARPELPYEIVLHTLDPSRAGLLDVSQARAARIRLRG